MLRSVLVGLTAMLMAFCLPAVLLKPPDEDPKDHRLLIVEETQETMQEDTILRLRTEEGVIDLPLETYLVGVVAAEMPLSFHSEALKAQAVAARTFALQHMDNGKHEDADLCAQSNCCQAWFSPEQMEKKLGDSKSVLEAKAGDAVSATKGEMLTYNGALIDAVYFSCSGGMTESAAAVWGNDIPYLQPVESPGEESAIRYQSSVVIEFSEFLNTFSELNLPDNPAAWFGEIRRTDGNGVAEIEIGGVSYTGTELRSLFRLNSTMFDVAITDAGIVFETKGFGHRVGMSQYGANAMALNGNSYKEILAHYYPGTTLE